jgi:hypothetical protein
MSDTTPQPGIMQRIIHRLRQKRPEGTVEDRAAKAKAGAKNLVQSISDTNAPGAIQRRQQLYEDIGKQTE